MSGLEKSGPGSKPNGGITIPPQLTDEALDLIAEIKLKSEDLNQVTNLLLLTSGKELRSGGEDLYIICETQFKVIARELSELLTKAVA